MSVDKLPCYDRALHFFDDKYWHYYRECINDSSRYVEDTIYYYVDTRKSSSHYIDGRNLNSYNLYNGRYRKDLFDNSVEFAYNACTNEIAFVDSICYRKNCYYVQYINYGEAMVSHMLLELLNDSTFILEGVTGDEKVSWEYRVVATPPEFDKILKQ